jgi:acetyltransferase-like isoleucine patch superfamily enzyme
MKNKTNIYDSQIRNCRLETGITIITPVNLYECTIGAYTKIGPFVEIQRGVFIGTHCNIQSHSFICEQVTIGHHCFIGHGVMFTNDSFKKGNPNPDPNSWEETIIGNNVSIGSGVTLLPVQICPHAVIGAGSVVTKNISQPGIYFGNPAKYYREIT